MGCHKRCWFTACGFLGVFISIILGAIVGILFAFSFIPNIVTVAWIAFGLGILTLIFLIAGVFLSASDRHEALVKCTRRNTSCLLAGTIGTIITSIAALAIVLTPAFISVITLVAIGAFFVSLMLIGLISYILCIVCELE